MQKDFVFLILNCHKYRNKALQQTTWLKTLPDNIAYYHVIGDVDKCSQSNTDYIFDETEHILYVNTKDDYNSLPTKVVHALGAVNVEFDYKYIFKTDDDQMLIEESFFDDFPQFLIDNPKHEYGGFIVNVPDHISQYYKVHDCLPRDLLLKKCIYCNGRFYFLSKSATESLISKKEDICKHIIEDHAIGLYLDDKYKENMLYFDTRQIFKDNT